MRGDDAVWVEREDGDLRIVPVSWTALVPRASLVDAHGDGARLSPEAAFELSKWVLARKDRS
jgi:hypothetical protein